MCFKVLFLSDDSSRGVGRLISPIISGIFPQWIKFTAYYLYHKIRCNSAFFCAKDLKFNVLDFSVRKQDDMTKLCFASVTKGSQNSNKPQQKRSRKDRFVSIKFEFNKRIIVDKIFLSANKIQPKSTGLLARHSQYLFPGRPNHIIFEIYSTVFTLNSQQTYAGTVKKANAITFVKFIFRKNIL